MAAVVAADVGEVRGYAAILTASALFGASATVGWTLLNSLGVHPISALVLVHLIASLPFLRWAARVKFRKTDWKLLLLWGVNGAALAPYLWFSGIPLTTAPEAALLANLEALFTVIFAYVFLHERVPQRGYLGIAALLVGAVAVTTEFDFATFGFTEHLLGNSLLIASAAAFGLDNNVSRVVIGKYDRRGAPFYKLWIGLAIMIPIALALGLPFRVDGQTLPLIAFLAFGAVTGVIWFFYIAFEEIGTMRTGAIISTSALFGVAVAFAVLGDRPSAPQLFGGLLMIFGTFLTTEWRPRFRRNRRG